MKNYRVILIAVIVISFLAGTALGYWGGQAHLKHRFLKSRFDQEYLKTKVMGKLDNMLRLDDEQRVMITTIVDETIKEHKEMLKDFRSKMEKLRDKKSREMKAVLTDEQKEKFEEWQEKRKEKWIEKKAKYMGHMGYIMCPRGCGYHERRY